ncbi:MAG: FG-GAP-like repeat-containing protein [bacterium]
MLYFITIIFILLNAVLSFGQESVKIESVSPRQNALHAPREVSICAIFTAPMDTASITGQTFLVRGEDSGPQTGMVSYDSSTNTTSFKPNTPLFAGEVVTVTLANKIQTAEHQPFAGFTWQFTVEAFQATPPFFAEGRNVRLPQAQKTLYTVDVDGDGDLDIISGQRATDEPVTVIRNDGKGNFLQQETYKLRVDARSIFGNDFDNDGDVDLVVTTALTEGTIAVLFNDGNGFFNRVTRFTQSSNDSFGTVRVHDGDINNDGYVDLIYVSVHRDSAFGLVGFMKNDGTGNFTETNQIKLRNRPGRPVIADFNNDGWLDVVVGMQFTVGQSEFWNGMGIFLNNCDGSFAEPQYYTYFLRTESLYSNDFDGDGDLDIAVSMNPEGLLIYLNDGQGAFPDSVDLRERDSVFNIWGADFDGDMDIDLLETETPSLPDVLLPVIRLYNNPGDAQFSSSNADILKMSDLNRGYGYRPDGGDLDGDGDIDLIVPFDSSGSWLSFFFNQAEPLSVEDGAANVPDDFVLEQNFPNPFNPETNIVFALPAKGRVKLTIFNVQGKKVITLLDDKMHAGQHLLKWDGKNDKGQTVGSGVYFYKLEVFQGRLKTGLKQFTDSRKMLLLR